MNDSIQISYLMKLIGFWQELNVPEQVLFRRILMLSTPDCPIGMNKDVHINQSIALAKFMTEIWPLDLEKEVERRWLSKASITACKSLLDKGLVWLDENHFQINDITLHFKEYTEQLPYSTKEIPDTKEVEDDDDLEKF